MTFTHEEMVELRRAVDELKVAIENDPVEEKVVEFGALLHNYGGLVARSGVLLKVLEEQATPDADQLRAEGWEIIEVITTAVAEVQAAFIERVKAHRYSVRL